MKIFALLVGINEYPNKPLDQSVKDVNKIEKHLDSLVEKCPKEEKEEKLKKLILKNKDATKANIVNGIKDFLGQATNEDVALFYYSGHGAQEQANCRFPDEPDDLIDGIVSFYTKEQQSGYLLANKEIRYLLGQLLNKPHLVTVFDCCHAGDMVRNGVKIKNFGDPLSARAYHEFIFSESINENDLKDKESGNKLPFKNHIHIAACLSSQLAVEDGKGSIFTRYLIKLLAHKQNKLNYNDITRWVKIFIEDPNKNVQTPTLSIQGEGNINALCSWLNLHDEGSLESYDAHIIYNHLEGWYLSIGALEGITEDSTILVDPKGKKIKVGIQKLGLTSTLIDDPSLIDDTIDIDQIDYPATVDSRYSKLTLFLNNINGTPEDLTKVTKILNGIERVNLKNTTTGKIDFFINIKEGKVYISLPTTASLPLAKQIDLHNPKINLKDQLKEQVNYLIKWNHFYHLKNHDKNFKKIPIKLEIKLDGENVWKDITNKKFNVLAEYDDLRNRFLKIYEARITNVSEETLFIGLLTLQSDIGISSNPFDKKVIELKPKASKIFYDHGKVAKGGFFIDSYKINNNWKEEWMHFKFIVNNFGDFTPALQYYFQPSLPPPESYRNRDKETEEPKPKGNPFNAFNAKVNKWSTYKTTIFLENPQFKP